MTGKMASLALTIGLVASAASAAGVALKFDPPAGWVSKTPSSTMRVADYVLPKTGTDAEDATATVYFFGSGQGGTVQANLDRWVGQMSQPSGVPSEKVAKTTTFKTTSGLAVTLLDVTGTYIAEVQPGSSERLNKPGFRLRAAVIETAGGPYFVKLTGPAATVAKWDEAFLAFLKSARE